MLFTGTSNEGSVALVINPFGIKDHPNGREAWMKLEWIMEEIKWTRDQSSSSHSKEAHVTSGVIASMTFQLSREVGRDLGGVRFFGKPKIGCEEESSILIWYETHIATYFRSAFDQARYGL